MVCCKCHSNEVEAKRYHLLKINRYLDKVRTKDYDEDLVVGDPEVYKRHMITYFMKWATDHIKYYNNIAFCGVKNWNRSTGEYEEEIFCGYCYWLAYGD